jgi:hypothetical protein
VETSAHVKVRSGHLTTSSRARIEVTPLAAELVELRLATLDLELVAVLSGAHLDALEAALADARARMTADKLDTTPIPVVAA